MNFSPSSLAAAIGAIPVDAAADNSDATLSIPATDPSTDISGPIVPPYNTNPDPPDTTMTTTDADGTIVPSIRKSDDISPSPIRVSTLPPSRSQDPPKHARTSITSRATRFFLRDLTTIDPPEVKALFPIFKFNSAGKAKPSGDESAPNPPTPSSAAATTNVASTRDAPAPPSTLTLSTESNKSNNNLTTLPDDKSDNHKNSETRLDDILNTNNHNNNTILNYFTMDPPTPSTGINISTLATANANQHPASSYKPTPKDSTSKQLDFSLTTDHDSTPLSSVKMAPINKRTKNTSSTTQLKSSIKSKVVISPAAPEVRRYEKDSPATMKDPDVMDTHAPPHVHKFKTVFELSVKIPKTERVLHELSNKLLSALAFVQKYADPTAAFLPKSDPTLSHINNRLSFPTVIFPLEADYFVFGSPSWHYAPKGIRGKVIRFSAIIGSDVDPDRIARCRPDLNVMHVGIDIKAHQDIDTNTRIALLGAPNTINKKEAKNICMDIYKSALTLLQAEHPDDPISSTTTIPDFAIILTQPQGLPYVAQDNSEEKYTPPSKERRSLHIMCNTMDFEGFAKLTEVAKENDLWRPSFGMCYPTIVPQSDVDDDRLERYIRMIEIHESVQHCYTNTVISGLSNVDREFTLRKDDGSTATFTARKLLSHIKVYDPIPEKFVPVFLCLLRRDDHRFHAYFPGGNQSIQTYVDEFRKCPGPQLYFYLLKRRFLHGDVSKFIRSVFNLEQQALCSRAKYNKRTGMAFVNNTPGQMDIIDAAMASDSGFAVGTVTRSPALQPIKYSGPKDSAIEYYDFAEGQSITTIRTAKKKTSNTNSDVSIGIGKSVYEPEGSMAVSTIAPDDMDIDKDDDIGDDEFGNEFEFDLGALKETERLSLKQALPPDVTPAIPPYPTVTAEHQTTTMSEDDAKAIQEQLTLTFIARSNVADSLS